MHRYGYTALHTDLVVLVWYLEHNLPVIPLNPGTPAITFRGSRGRADVPTRKAAGDLESASQTGLSIITPPAVTRKVLAEAKEAGVRAVWLQPGSFDAALLEEAKRMWPGAAVGGMEDGASGEGWCVLLHGDWGMRLAGREKL